jgi:DNA replicative helicase MCM subunit Mcm2 (Cdc46/Mcm family)
VVFEANIHRYGLDSDMESSATANINDLYDIQIHISWNRQMIGTSKYLPDKNFTYIRELQATDISKLVRVEGIIINASRTSSKVLRAHLQCSHCKAEVSKPIRSGFSSIPIPKRCERYVYYYVKILTNPCDSVFH